jgi:hypothetical protein
MPMPDHREGGGAVRLRWCHAVEGKAKGGSLAEIERSNGGGPDVCG